MKHNGLQSIFNVCNSKTLNHSEIEIPETQPSATWKLPSISPSEVYVDLSMIHLKEITIISKKKCVSEVQQNCDTAQTIPLLNPKELQAEEKQHGTNYLHLGCIRIGVSTLSHRGLNTFVLATVRVLMYNQYTYSLICGIIAPLLGGTV